MTRRRVGRCATDPTVRASCDEFEDAAPSTLEGTLDAAIAGPTEEILMARVVYAATCSLDGYIAGPGGDMQWLQPYLQPNPEVERFSEEVGAMLVGRRTFTGDDPNRGTDAEGAFGGTWQGPVFVLTSQPPAGASDEVTFVTDLRAGVEQASAAAGDGVVDVLGAQTARSCLEAGLLDEVLMIVAPVLLGDGTPLFAVPGGREVPLDPVRVTPSGLVTNLWFRVPVSSGGSPTG